MRLNKYIAKTGLCNRRQAEHLVKSGKVMVNGQSVNNPGHDVNSEDVVSVNGEVVELKIPTKSILFNKPVGLFVTPESISKDIGLRQLLPDIAEYNLKPTDQLLPNSAGLMILTNDSTLLDGIKSNSIKLTAVFEVEFTVSPDEKLLSELRQALKIEEESSIYKSINLINTTKTQPSVGIEMRPTDDNKLMHDLEASGYQVKVMDRLFLGPLSKRDLPRKRSRVLTDQELIVIKHLSKG